MFYIVTEDTVGEGTRLSLSSFDSAYIAAGATVRALAQPAIVAQGQNVGIDIYGNVVGNQSGIVYNGPGSGGRITIGEGGMVGASNGEAISMSSSNFRIENAGHIVGETGIFVLGTGNSSINSSGRIVADVAIYNQDGDVNLSFVNTGVIEARYAYLSDQGNGIDTIVNSGRMTGNVVLGDNNDVYLGSSGQLVGWINGDDGNDLIVTGTGRDSLDGGAGNDRLYGGAGNDAIDGGLGNDFIDSGAGNDRLAGRAGADVFRFASAPSSTTNVDTIVDFVVKDDTIQLENLVMRGLGSKTGTLQSAFFWKSTSGLAHDANDRVIYDTDNGYLFYDSNGTAAGGRVLLAHLSPRLALTAADFIVT